MEVIRGRRSGDRLRTDGGVTAAAGVFDGAKDKENRRGKRLVRTDSTSTPESTGVVAIFIAFDKPSESTEKACAESSVGSSKTAYPSRRACNHEGISDGRLEAHSQSDPGLTLGTPKRVQNAFDEENVESTTVVRRRMAAV